MDQTSPDRVFQPNKAVEDVPGGTRDLLPLVYEQLKELAEHRMANERPDHTLQATALVHEVYLRLAGNREMPWSGRAEFFTAAAEAMRRILIDHARAWGGKKRGGGRRLPSSVLDLAAPDQFEEILSLDEAVSRLQIVSADLAAVVRLRFYAGLSTQETADVLGVTSRTVERRWSGARAWLFRELGY